MKARLFLAFIERIRKVAFYFFGCKASIFFLCIDRYLALTTRINIP